MQSLKGSSKLGVLDISSLTFRNGFDRVLKILIINDPSLELLASFYSPFGSIEIGKN
jgi:hypothetical protein